MRMVMVVPRFPRLSETFIVNKFLGLLDAGWDVHIACSQTDGWEPFPQLSTRPGIQQRVHRQRPHDSQWRVFLMWLPVLFLTFLRAPGNTWRYWRRGLATFGLRIVRMFYLDAHLIVASPDILHFEFGALAVGRAYLKELLDCRLSVSFRGYDLNYVGLETPDYYSEVWSAVDAVHTLGEDLWRRARQRGCPPDMPHAIIPPAIDTELFSRGWGFSESADDSQADMNRPLRILSVGRLEWKKGYEYALMAVAHLKAQGIPVTYRIIGGGSYLEALAFARHEMGLEEEVEFLGALPQPAIIEHFLSADVFLHAAVSEGFSNAVLEAQAMHLPVVCSDADGLPENVVDGLTGFVVPRRNALALAEKLSILAADGDLRRRMGEAGRARVETCFQLREQIAAFDRFYREMVVRHAD